MSRSPKPIDAKLRLIGRGDGDDGKAIRGPATTPFELLSREYLHLATGDREPGQHSGSHGPVRRMLKLLVEVDSSRFLGNRLGAGLVLVGILAGFAAIGYGLPALLSRYF